MYNSDSISMLAFARKREPQENYQNTHEFLLYLKPLAKLNCLRTCNQFIVAGSQHYSIANVLKMAFVSGLKQKMYWRL